MSLKEKQNYYTYGAAGWTYKEPPALPPEVSAEMKRRGLDKDYRFTWGGVAIYRDEPNGEVVKIRGAREACEPMGGILLPRYLFARARQPKCFAYRDELGQTIRTTREEFIPPGRIAAVEFEYVDYGILRWFMEYRVKAETMVEVNAATKETAREEWLCIQKLETPGGLYYEPNMLMVHMLARREYENRNESLREVGKKEKAARKAIVSETEEREERDAKAEWDEMYAAIERGERKQTVYSLPGVRPMAIGCR